MHKKRATSKPQQGSRKKPAGSAEGKVQSIDVGRAEMEKYQPPEEIAREFSEEGRRGSEPRGDLIHEVRTMEPRGVVDRRAEDADALGDESPTGDQPTPDLDAVEEIGRAEGVTYEDNEPLRPMEKVEKRDRNRWELDPASERRRKAK
jgi:hypothetical protein